MKIDIDEITQDGYFTKWPHEGWQDNAHLRLAALIGKEPVGADKAGDTYAFEYESSRDDVKRVVTVSTKTRWLYTSVHRPDELPLLWEEEEDIVRTARWWIGLDGNAPYHLIRDDEWIANLSNEDSD